MKKYLILIMLICTISNVCFFSVNVFGKTNSLDDFAETFEIEIIEDENPVDKEILINVYRSIPVYDNENNIIQFNNEYYEKYYITSNYTVIEKISEYMLIEIDLDSLPLEYGISEQSCFIDSSRNSLQLYLGRISTYEIINNNVEFFSSSNKKIFSNFKVSDIVNNDIFENDTDNCFAQDIVIEQNYKRGIQENRIKNINNLSRSIFDVENEFRPSYGNVKSVQNSGSKFIVYYDGDSMTKTNAQKVANRIEMIDDYFCGDEIGLLYSRPKTNSDNEFKIYLEKNEEMGGLFGYTQQDILSNKLGNKEGVYSYIVLDYDLVGAVNDYSDASTNSFINTLAHEYFHALQAQLNLIYTDNNNSKIDWIIESTATMAGLYYCNEINTSGVADYWIKNLFKNRVDNYLVTSNQPIYQYTEDNSREYSTFLFPLYLVKEFGFDIIKELIVSVSTDENVLQDIDDILQIQDTSLMQVFKEFSICNSYMSNHYNDILIGAYINNWELSSPVGGYYNIDDASHYFGGFSISNLGAEYIRLSSANNSTYNAFVTIEFSSIENVDLTSVRKSESGDLYNYTYNLSTNSITIPQYNFGYHICEELTFVITNYSISNSNTEVDYNVEIQNR